MLSLPRPRAQKVPRADPSGRTLGAQQLQPRPRSSAGAAPPPPPPPPPPAAQAPPAHTSLTVGPTGPPRRAPVPASATERAGPLPPAALAASAEAYLQRLQSSKSGDPRGARAGPSAAPTVVAEGALWGERSPGADTAVVPPGGVPLGSRSSSSELSFPPPHARVPIQPALENEALIWQLAAEASAGLTDSAAADAAAGSAIWGAAVGGAGSAHAAASYRPATAAAHHHEAPPRATAAEPPAAASAGAAGGGAAGGGRGERLAQLVQAYEQPVLQFSIWGADGSVKGRGAVPSVATLNVRPLHAV